MMPKNLANNVLFTIELNRVYPIAEYNLQMLLLDENAEFNMKSRDLDFKDVINSNNLVKISIVEKRTDIIDIFEGKSFTSCILKLGNKSYIKLNYYSICEDLHESLQKFYKKLKDNPDIALIDFNSWQILTKNVELTDRTLEHSYLVVENIDISKVATHLALRFEEFPKYERSLERLNYYSIDDDEIPYLLTKQLGANPVTVPNLDQIPGIGTKRAELLRQASIPTVCDLLKKDYKTLVELRSIGKKTLNKVLLNINRFGTLPIKNCEIIGHLPQHAIFTDSSTELEAYSPKYLQLFVGGLPFYKSGVFEELQILLQEEDEPFNSYNFKFYKKGFQIDFEYNKRLEVYGPWIVELINLDSYETDLILRNLFEAIKNTQKSLNLVENCFILVDPQENDITPEQFLESLQQFQSLSPNDPFDLIRMIRRGEITELVVDTSIIVDNRLSFILAEELLESQSELNFKIIIPNIVMYEIKAWGDKKTDAGLQRKNYWATAELKKLYALHEAAYISLDFQGDLPPFPHTIKPEGGYMFSGALRDENILLLVDKTSPTSYILTSDRRQALSTKLRGLPLIYLESVSKILHTIKQDLEQAGELFELWIQDEDNLDELSTTHYLSMKFLREKINEI